MSAPSSESSDEEKNLELRAAAHELGFTPAKLSAIETNHNLPSEEDLNKFAELLETSVDDFHQAYQHPRTIRRTPPEQSKRIPIHLQGKPLDEVDIAMHYRANIRWSARFRQPTW
jgi:transcriptional regulator with XRE-family HTH domain